MELIKTAGSTVISMTRKELKYYSDEAIESFIQGKRRIIFNLEEGNVDTLVVREDV